MRTRFSISLLTLLTLSGCGGGGGSGGSGTSSSSPPSPTFSLSLNPTSLAVVQGSSQTVAIQVVAQNGFSGSVSISAAGMPSGITVSPTPLVIVAGSSGNLSVSVASDAPMGSEEVMLTAVSGSLTVNDPLDIAVRPLPQFAHIGGEPETGFYDESRQLLFVCNQELNEIDVLGADLSFRTRILVPLPSGIDQMADGKTLVVGTRTQAIYTIDEGTLAARQHVSPNFAYLGTTQLLKPVAMANGKVLIIGQDDFSSVVHVIEWNSNTGNFTEVFPVNFPSGYTFTYARIKRSGDHQWAILIENQLCLYSSSSDAFIATVPPDSAGVEDVAANPTGTQFATISGVSVTFYDQGLNVLGTVSTTLGTFDYDYSSYSTDGSRLYWQLPYDLDVIDTSKFIELGYVPTSYDSFQPWLLFVDSAQRAFMGAAGGVAMADCTTLYTGPPYGGIGSPSPSVVPLNASPPVTFGYLPAGATITFGGVPGAVQNYSAGIVAPPPSPVAGPVDIASTLPDGENSLMPNGFEYGVDVVTATATLLPPIGNPTFALFGFGMINPSWGAPAVTVGGQSTQATVNTLNSLLQEIFVQVPSGGSGSPAITASSNYGVGTLQNAITYIPSATIVPDSGILQLLYDQHRNLVYALKPKQIDVLNPSTLQWQAPLLPGGSGGFEYTCMALTPDGSKMLVVDPGANPTTLTIFNPESPAQSTTVKLLPYVFRGIVATSTGKAFLFIAQMDGTGEPFEFDLSTMTYSTSMDNSYGFGDLTTFTATPDGNHVVAVENTLPASISLWNMADDSFTQTYADAFWSDVALSADGSIIAPVTGAIGLAGAAADFLDAQLQLLGTTVYPDLSPPLEGEVLGAILSPSGQTLVSPLGDSIEFFNVATGRLVGRLMTPEPLPIYDGVESTPWRALALDPTGQTIFANSASGVTVMKLPVPIDQLSPPPSIFSYRTAARKIPRAFGLHYKSRTLRDSLPRLRNPRQE